MPIQISQLSIFFSEISSISVRLLFKKSTLKKSVLHTLLFTLFITLDINMCQYMRLYNNQTTT